MAFVPPRTDPTGYYSQRAAGPYSAPAPNAPTNQYGTQANPLSSFFSASGATGNKTTNKDLPQWLRDLGMKGDAYAGGMLKPELRYGFKYKDGQIHFADGTSFAATKNKGGTYSYTGADGKATTYSPTDEQNAYNKKYQASTSNQSFLDKAKNTIGFELDHGLQATKELLSHPQRAFTGAIDPLGTKISNAVTGSNYKPIVDQLGGALPGRYDDYTNRTGNSTGFAKPLQGAAHVIAAAYGANGLSHLGQAGVQSLGTASTPASEGAVGWGGADTGGFNGASDFSMAGIGGGNAGQLAAAGGISGGAGNGIGGSLGGSGVLSQNSIGNAAQLAGLFGSNSGGQQQQMSWVPPGLLGSQTQQPQDQVSPITGLPINTQMPYIPARGYNAHNFYGSTIWS